MKEEDFLTELRMHIAGKYHSKSNAAKAWGVTPGYVTNVVKGRTAPNKTILDDIGFARETEMLVNYTRL